MKKKLLSSKHPVNLLTVCLLATSPLVIAANYDALNRQQDNFSNMDQLAPQPGGQGISTLESFQQAEQSNKRSSYIETLNLLKQNKLDEAEKKISTLLKKDANEPEYYNLKALLETLKKNTVAAEENYKKAITLNPQNIMSHLGLAKLFLDTKQIDKAKDYATKALAISDKAVNAYILLADIAFVQKDTAEAEKLLRTAKDKAHGSIIAEVEVIKSLGKLYNFLKQPEKIVTLTEDLSSRYPDNTTALALLVQAQLINNNKPAAKQALEKIIDQDKQDIGNRLLLAKLLIEDPAKEKETLALLDETAQIDAKNPEPLMLKSAYFMKLKRFPEATAEAAKVDQQFPKLVIGKLLKGDIFLAQKQLDKATEQYQQAYKMQPNDRILLTLADLLRAQKKLPEAIKLLDSAVAKDNKNLAAHFKLGNIYQEQNDNKKAEEHSLSMLSTQPDNVLALNNLAYLYMQQNNPKALELAKKALEKAPDSPAVMDTYGYIQLKQGQAKEGLATLEKAVGLAPKAKDIQFHLAEAYVANDNASKAIEILEPLVSTEPDFAEKKAATDLLNKLKAQ